MKRKTAGVKIVLYIFFPVFLFLFPSRFFESLPSLCLYKNFLGRECWGCGMTRAFFSFLHGDFQEALRYNRLIIVVFPLSAFLYGRNMCNLFAGIFSRRNINNG